MTQLGLGERLTFTGLVTGKLICSGVDGLELVSFF
jgi:hypothetical protein